MGEIGSVSSIFSSSSASSRLTMDKNVSEGNSKKEKPLNQEVKIKDNHNGTYTVSIVCNGKVIKTERVTKKELLAKYATEAREQGIDLQGTNSAKEAQEKYGSHVANNFYLIG